MSLVCQNAEDNAYVMIEIFFRFDNVFQAHWFYFPLFSICHFIHVLVHVITVWNRRLDWQIRDEVKVHLAQ